MLYHIIAEPRARHARYEEAIAISISLNSCNRYPRFEGNMQPGLTSFASIRAPITCRQRLLPILLRRAAIANCEIAAARVRTLPRILLFSLQYFIRVQSDCKKRNLKRRINFGNRNASKHLEE